MTRVFFEEAKGVQFGLIYGVNEVYSIFLMFILKNGFYSGLSLRAGGRGFSPATKRVAPGYFYWKIEEK